MNDPLVGPLLVIGAHPDDTEFGAGGTIAAFRQRDQEVHYVVCTDGSKGTKDRTAQPLDLVATREREQQAAADLLGVKSVTFLRQVDGELQPTMACRTALARVIRRVRPRVMITHDPWRLYQLHPDHRAAGFLSTDAFVAARDHLYAPELLVEEGLEPYDVPEIWFYAPAEVDFFVDISGSLERKIEAVRCHTSQLRDPAGIADRMRSRAGEVGARHGVPYAEEFKRLKI
ncbi:MAG TPA: PIG-L deacetylase family protein [Chloroflexota bacterium]|jgi:LmbE family N-acetylglucosaminyl deacetylase|nr:PIG-L deacetylase family protein [Chloroflexota bacterium]